MVSTTDLPSTNTKSPRPMSSLQRSRTVELSSLSPPTRTDTTNSTSSLPSTSLKSKRLHDMLHSHHHHAHPSQSAAGKHKRKESSHDDVVGVGSGAGAGAGGGSGASASPLKAASALLHGLVQKPSSSYNNRHSRSASALERIASKTAMRNSPLVSANGSRRESMINVDAHAIAAENSLATARERPVKAMDVLRERQRNVIRAEEVRDVYCAVEEEAKEAEGRLDDVFGGLQTKVAVLRGAIEELQGLVGETGALREKFERERGEVEREAGAKIEGFEVFGAQSRAIEVCEERMAEGRRRVGVANERLKRAKIRVEEWERREDEWQRRTSTQLRVGWITALAAFVVLIMVLAIRKWLFATQKPGVDVDAFRQLLDNTAMPSFAAEDLQDILSSRVQDLSQKATATSSVSLASDARLKLLDEL